MPKLGNDIALWRPENQIIPPCLPDVEFNLNIVYMVARLDFQIFIVTMEFHVLGIILNCSKKLLHCVAHFDNQLLKTITFKQEL